jgi:ATP-dependent DNA ligase
LTAASRRGGLSKSGGHLRCASGNCEGGILFEHACKLGCEGIVSKRLGSLYRSGRSPHWLKDQESCRARAVKREVKEDWA